MKLEQFLDECTQAFDLMSHPLMDKAVLNWCKGDRTRVPPGMHIYLHSKAPKGTNNISEYVGPYHTARAGDKPDLEQMASIAAELLLEQYSKARAACSGHQPNAFGVRARMIFRERKLQVAAFMMFSTVPAEALQPAAAAK